MCKWKRQRTFSGDGVVVLPAASTGIAAAQSITVYVVSHTYSQVLSCIVKLRQGLLSSMAMAMATATTNPDMPRTLIILALLVAAANGT